jgi:hypothetical protein
MKLASQSQLSTLAAHGQLEDRDYTSKEASSLISELIKSDHQPDWKLANESAELIRSIETRQLRKAIEGIEANLAKEGLAESKVATLREQLSDYNERLAEIEEEIKEGRESLKEEKELLKERVDDFQSSFEPGGELSGYLKKPTKQQIRKCVEAMDKADPDWETTYGEDALVSTLAENFPDLKKQSSPSKVKGKSHTKKKGKGCLAIIAILLAPIIIWALHFAISTRG